MCVKRGIPEKLASTRILFVVFCVVTVAKSLDLPLTEFVVTQGYRNRDDLTALGEFYAPNRVSDCLPLIF